MDEQGTLFGDDGNGKTLAQARKEFNDKLREGSVCECCDRLGKIQKEGFISCMAVTLIRLYHFNRSSPGAWMHIAKQLPYSMHQGRYGKLVHWGMAEAKKGQKDDGNPNKGLYRITEAGKAFVERRVRVNKYMFLYNDTPYDLDEGDGQISIDEALGKGFNYGELMSA